MRFLSLVISILPLAVVTSSVSASSVTFIIDASANDGTFDVFADVSLGDNAGLSFYVIQFDGTNDDLVDQGPRAVNSVNFSPQGFYLNLLTGPDQQRLARGMWPLNPSTLVYGFGQTPGSLLNPVGIPGDSLQQPDYGAPLWLGSGTYTDINSLEVLEAVANTWDAEGGTAASQATTNVLMIIEGCFDCGGSEDNPILPDYMDENGSWVFENLDTTDLSPNGGWWFDPPTDHAMLYEITDGVSEFGVVGMPTVLSHPDANESYIVTSSEGSVVVPQGAVHNFGPGITNFSVSDILPTVDGDNPIAFPTFLSFSKTNDGLVSFTMTPVPEPSALIVCGLGLIGLLGCRHRDGCMMG